MKHASEWVEGRMTNYVLVGKPLYAWWWEDYYSKLNALGMVGEGVVVTSEGMSAWCSGYMSGVYYSWRR